MKAYRGTLVAGAIAGILGLITWLHAPELLTPVDDDAVILENSHLVQFEPHELVSVRVERADGDVIVLREGEDGHWGIEGTGYVASRSMVNRVKHQFHELSPRAIVTEAVEDPALYGLGSRATRVQLELRDGKTISLLAGLPNPSSVSYYVQPLPGTAVYTVQKAAVDYLSMDRSRFRENRFVRFEAGEVSRLAIHSELEGTPEELVIVRTGDRSWKMEAPVEMEASDDRVRRLLGRLSALKAKTFIEESEQSPDQGLENPRARWSLEFNTGDPLVVEIGAPTPEQGRTEDLAFMRLNGQGTVFVAKAGLLEELQEDPLSYRNREVVPIEKSDLISIEAVLRTEEDEDLAGEQGVRFAAEQWLWSDGVPVPGSTPDRVARTLTGISVEEFIDDAPESLEPYGLDNPVAQVWLEAVGGFRVGILVGDSGESLVDLEGHETRLRYLMLVDNAPVYLVDERVLRVIHDLIREGNRKDKNDQERALAGDRIEDVVDGLETVVPVAEEPSDAEPSESEGRP